MPELPFDSEELEQLILRFNAVMAREENDIPDPGGNETDNEWPATLQETSGNLDRAEIAAEIEGMDDDQQDALVALFWIGRGDAEPEEWDATTALARDAHDVPVSTYLLGQPEAGDFLAEGLDKMLDYGVD